MTTHVDLTSPSSSLIKNKRLRAQIAELAKKGFCDPGVLSEDEIWHICRGMLSYLNELLETDLVQRFAQAEIAEAPPA